MEQLKVVIANIQKYHFWILCVSVMLVGFISWFMVKSNLDAETANNLNTIKGKDGEIQMVLNTPDHPNEKFDEGMKNILLPFSVQVGQGWLQRYSQQARLLVWPKSLTDEFIDQVDHLRPIEQIAFPTPVDKEIPTRYLDVYRNFIESELPKLAGTIGAKWHAQLQSEKGKEPANVFNQGTTLGADGMALKPVDKSVVFWSEQNQRELLDIHFAFISGKRTPSTLEVLYAQEDLWVLQALMQIIKRTNGGADANYDAAIKEIHSIQIGKTTRGRMGKISAVVERRAHAEGAAPGTAPPASPPPPITSPTAPGMAANSPERADPAYERYVDVDYNPLPPTTLRGATTTSDPKVAIYAVAKRIPVRLRLLMDQRNVNELVANCGNFNLPVEVRQVRINSPAGLASDEGVSFSAAPASMAGSYGSGDGGYGAMSGSGGGGSSSSSGSGAAARLRPGRAGTGAVGDKPAEDPNEIELEVYGIVYIFNPVNEKMLGVELQRTVANPATPPPSVPVADKSRG